MVNKYVIFSPLVVFWVIVLNRALVVCSVTATLLLGVAEEVAEAGSVWVGVVMVVGDVIVVTIGVVVTIDMVTTDSHRAPTGN